MSQGPFSYSLGRRLHPGPKKASLVDSIFLKGNTLFIHTRLPIPFLNTLSSSWSSLLPYTLQLQGVSELFDGVYTPTQVEPTLPTSMDITFHVPSKVGYNSQEKTLVYSNNNSTPPAYLYCDWKHSFESTGENNNTRENKHTIAAADDDDIDRSHDTNSNSVMEKHPEELLETYTAPWGAWCGESHAQNWEGGEWGEIEEGAEPHARILSGEKTCGNNTGDIGIDNTFQQVSEGVRSKDRRGVCQGGFVLCCDCGCVCVSEVNLAGFVEKKVIGAVCLELAQFAAAVWIIKMVNDR